MRFSVYGGVRVVHDDGSEVRLGDLQRRFLALLLLRPGQVVGADVLIDGLWDGCKRSSPPNSLHELVGRVRSSLGDHHRRVVVCGRGGYRIVVHPEAVDVGVFRRCLRAAWALQSVEPVLAHQLLRRALDHAEGDLPDIRPDNPMCEEVFELYRWRDDACAAVEVLARADPPGDPGPSGSCVPASSSLGAVCVALRVAELHPSVVADAVCRTVDAGGAVRRLSGGLFESSFPSARTGLQGAADIVQLLPSAPESLLGGAVGHVAGGERDGGYQGIAQLAGRASPGQVLVTTPVAHAAATAGCPVALHALGGDLHEMALPLRSSPSATRGASEPPLPLVGREKDASAVQALIATCPAVTIRGPGGVGKTRLAAAVAQAVGAAGGEAIEVDLAGVGRPDEPVSHIARAVGVLPDPYRSLRDTLLDRLRDRALLLVLDNCEEVVEEVGALCEAMTAAAPLMHVLATSRVALGAHMEIVHDLDVLSPEDSAVLFLALAHQDGVPVAKESEVARLCEIAGGIPLAIECAAALCRAMGHGAAIAALDSLPDGALLPVLDVAHGGRGRHLSIERCLTASYHHLSPLDAELFERLSCLRGSFDADDAAVAAPTGAGQLAGALGQLVDASLLKLEDAGRWRMLEPVRQYAAMVLVRRGEGAAQAARHARHFVALAEDADAGLRGPDEGEWFARLGRVRSNLDAALGWALSNHDAAAALGLTTSLWWYWSAKGMCVEGSAALEAALALDEDVPPIVRAKALIACSHLSWWAGNPARTATAARVALDLTTSQLEQSADPEVVTLAAWAHTGLGAAEMWGGGDRAVPEAHLVEGARLFRSAGSVAGLGVALATHGGLAWHHGDDRLSLARVLEACDAFAAAGHRTQIALTLRGSGLAKALLGDVEEGRRRMQEGLDLSEQLGDTGGMPMGLALSGYVEEMAGRPTAAADAFAASLAANRDLGQAWAALLGITYAGRHAVASGRERHGVRLLSTARRYSERTGIRVAPHEQQRVDRAWGKAAEHLPTLELDRAIGEGSRLDVADAMKLAAEIL